MAKKAQKRHQQAVHMGLGDAVQRLLKVEFIYRMGAGQVPEKLLEERNMLLEALNVIPVEVGFDCNSDNVPDDVGIFEQAVHTSCCRILSLDNSRVVPPPPAAAPPKGSTSRSAPKRKETTEGHTPSVTKSPGADLASVPVAVAAPAPPVAEPAKPAEVAKSPEPPPTKPVPLAGVAEPLPKAKRGVLSRIFKKDGAK